MQHKTKKRLTLAASLAIAGLFIAAAGMIALDWDFARLNTGSYETNAHTIADAFRNIEIIADTADILFVPSEEEECQVICYEASNARHSVSIKDDTLLIQVMNQKKWHDYIGIHFASPHITIRLPKAEYGNLSIRTATGNVILPKDYYWGDVTITASTGDIQAEQIAAVSMDLSVSTGKISISQAQCQGNLSLTVSTGEIYLTDILCSTLSSSGSTGAISLKQAVAKEMISITRSTGDVTLGDCDAAEIFIQCDTGHVLGILLSEKIIFAETSTGKVDVPQCTTGGTCKIITSTGDIRISIAK